ncbi:ankyrin [Microthyrium microscopicum]|uniref:Ankyrin n=1 Tax=Microthyrium microscopicum TaxID=703497 RepID=A0A6A6U3E8_9PEZI|nr:ankyrin [Microthyrium microscopicum]
MVTSPEFLVAVGEPDKVRRLLEDGLSPAPEALYACIVDEDEKSDMSLQLMLESGLSADARPDYADGTNSLGVKHDWAMGDWSTLRRFVPFRREWNGLYRASTISGVKSRVQKLQTIFLAHGADPYALFRQPLQQTQQHSGFPDFYTSYDLDDVDALEQMDLEVYFDQQDDFETIRYNPHYLNRDRAIKANNNESDGEELYFEILPDPTSVFKHYGVRSVIHALLEEGAYVKPILELPGIDLEHRDPQGRTLLLSASRSAMGTDASVDARIAEVRAISRGYARQNPLLAGTQTTSSLAQYLIDKGADPFAVDNYGKNCLFGLLEAYDNEYSGAPPIADQSLRYLSKLHPELVNQPDNAGNYPLHAALRRRLLYYHGNSSQQPKQLETSVFDLLEAGADPHTLDELGNSVFHYLADNGLADPTREREQRRLFEEFAKQGVDLNLRNKSGYTALQLLMKSQDDRDCGAAVWTNGKTPVEIIRLFENAGARLDDIGPDGQTLLHLLSLGTEDKAWGMARYLLGMGHDPLIKDGNGETAVDVVRRIQVKSLIEVFTTFGYK